ncbi:BTAD domain-containing putative transcriptional regulator [Streptomyces sp. NPDC048277]|uniref:BTAD domain-containing putative transcriptional regulator n=1 Tax=Streptomyces sp. NPDC048277 TaxID=3155027 RepID=UPI0033FCD5F5
MADRPATGDQGLRIGILGGLTATDPAGALDLGGRRQRAVLAVLVLARGRIVSTDQLIDSLWDQAPPPSALGALHAYVSHLRRRFEPDRAAKSRNGFIVREGSGYALRIAEDAVDAWRFERAIADAATLADPVRAAATLRGALELWHGPLLAEYTGQPWAAPEAARLAELREVARERLLAARLDCGESALLIPEAEALVAEGPLREERYRLLALALYRAHRQGEALGALRRARELLARELGIDPGPALLALEADVLAQSPALMPLPDGRPALAPPASGPRPADLHRPGAADDLLDRDRELADLRDCVTGLLAGESGLVLMEGPAGIGKSRLLAELRRLVDGHDVLVLRARGSRREQEYGFGAVRQLLGHAVARSRERLLTGAAAHVVGVFDERTTAPGSVPEGFAVLSGLYRVVAALAAERPVLLCVDDLQWCDSASRHFLAYLARRLDGLPLLIAVTVRSGESDPDDAALTELAQDPTAVRIHPAPLGAESVAALVRRRLGGPGEAVDESFAEACRRATAGNPLLLHLLLRALRAEGASPCADQVGVVTELGSRAVSSLVLARLAQLPEASATAARAVAVLGDDAELPAVAQLTGLSESAVAEAIAPLVRAEVIRDRYPLGFVHPLIGEAVYRDLAPGERRLFHERAAHALAGAVTAPERVAAQVLPAPHRGDVRVVDTMCTAAAAAPGRGATGSAAACPGPALLEPPLADLHPGLLLALGRATFLNAGPTSAMPHLGEAYWTLSDPALWRGGADPVVEAARTGQPNSVRPSPSSPRPGPRWNTPAPSVPWQDCPPSGQPGRRLSR